MGHLRIENTQVVPPPAFYCMVRVRVRARGFRVRVWVRVWVRVRVGAWMSQCREQSQVGRFTPRPGLGLGLGLGLP